MSNDLVVSYGGGSGGFLFLHFLLLSDQYYCVFKQENDLVSQWDINNPSSWKSTEIWPDNLDTLSTTTDQSKIYFFCNPTIEKLSGYHGKKIVVYTSLDNQLRLASFKRANWFLNKSEFSHNREIVSQWQQYYNNIRDTSWPDCPNLKYFEGLPPYIRNEILSQAYIQDYYPRQSIKSRLIKKEGTVINDTLIDHNMAYFINTADLAVKLEDFVNTNGNLIVDQLNLPPVNLKQKQLISKWKKLHPTSLLTQIGIVP